VTQDDLLYRFRLRVFAMAAELGNVRAACRAMGIHPSTYYRWKRQLDRHGPEILRPRERRVPRMANQTSVLVEQRVVAFALGHPGFGPARIAAELAQPRWGQLRLSFPHLDQLARPHGRCRPGRPWLEPRAGHERQRLGVPLSGLPADGRRPWRPSDVHPSRQATDERCVERVQQTILDECWKPAFARYLIPKQTGLRLDLERYLRYYNTERAYTGRWTRGRTPDEVLGKAKLWQRRQ
jgi:hypothetical protein